MRLPRETTAPMWLRGFGRYDGCLTGERAVRSGGKTEQCRAVATVLTLVVRGY
jgi:hypothetical protein